MASHRPWTCVLLLAVFALGSCTKEPDPMDPPPEETPPILDPRLFDCTQGTAPKRTSTVPLSCALDRTCRLKQIAGHRGAGGMLGKIAPEDTLAAYRAAIALGIEYAETDPRVTADGELVNLHDPTVDRTTTGTGEAAKMTLAQIQALPLKTAGFPGDYACERIPTLTQVLRTCLGKIVVLVDANKTSRVDLLVKAIVEAEALEWAIFDTSDVDKIDQALKLEPRLHFHIRPRTLEAVTEQLDHFAPRIPQIVELSPTNWGEAALAADLVHSRGSRAFVDVFVEDVSAALGDPRGYERALASGIDILQTDRPDLVLSLLRKRGDRR